MNEKQEKRQVRRYETKCNKQERGDEKRQNKWQTDEKEVNAIKQNERKAHERNSRQNEVESHERNQMETDEMI